MPSEIAVTDYSADVSALLSCPISITTATAMITTPCCSLCNRRSTRLKMCGGCGASFYCGWICQKAHWENHKSACQAIRAWLRSLNPLDVEWGEVSQLLLRRCRDDLAVYLLPLAVRLLQLEHHPENDTRLCVHIHLKTVVIGEAPERRVLAVYAAESRDPPVMDRARAPGNLLFLFSNGGSCPDSAPARIAIQYGRAAYVEATETIEKHHANVPELIQMLNRLLRGERYEVRARVWKGTDGRAGNRHHMCNQGRMRRS